MTQFCKHGLPAGMCRLGEFDCEELAWQGLSDKDVKDLADFWEVSDIEIEPFIKMVLQKVKDKKHGQL